MKEKRHYITETMTKGGILGLSFSLAKRVGNPSSSARFRTSRNDNSLRTYYVVKQNSGRLHAA